MKLGKKDSGITLVSLVVTIIVIIIISSITISVTFGENGIIKKAGLTKDLASNFIEEENGDMNRVMSEHANVMGGHANVVLGGGEETETKKGWSYDEEGNITNGEVTVEIGDYVDYNCKTGQSITSYKAQNGYKDQTFTTDSYNYGWRVLGVDEETGELLIISEELIGPVTGGGSSGSRTTYILGGREGHVNGENELRKISTTYGNGEGATRARSIKVEDINKITGYNPNNVGVYDPGQTDSGKKYGEDSIFEYGNKVTYTRSSRSKVQYSGTNGQSGTGTYSQFTYYTGSEWKSLNVGENAILTNNAYFYYPDTLTANSSGSTVGIAKTSRPYKMLFTNSSTGANTSQSGTTSGVSYWLGDQCFLTNSGFVYFNMRSVNSGYVESGNTVSLCRSDGGTGISGYGVRPVVSLQLGISLKNSTTQKDGCTLWNIVYMIE